MPDETLDALDGLPGIDGTSSYASFLREVAAISEPGTGEFFVATWLKTGEVPSGRCAIERLAGRDGMGAAYRELDGLSEGEKQ